MGGGSWSSSDYQRSARGADAFRVSRDTMAKAPDERKLPAVLDPKGLKIRESRDSAEHPESNAVIVGLDVTGSMGAVVIAIQSSLGKSMTMLLEDDYLPHPQLMFCAVGDASCDQFPLQVSQFESDLRINEQVSSVILEGGGGGQRPPRESYDELYYVAARHTDIDCWNKRGRKGYLFSIGDEGFYDEVRADEIEAVIGSNLERDIPTVEIIREAQEKYHTFHIIPKGSSNAENQWVRERWIKPLGRERVMILDLPQATAELIAVTIGLNEGVVTLDEAIGRVAELSGKDAAEAVRNAVEPLAKYLAKNPPKKQSRRKASTRTRAQADEDDWKL